MSNRTDHQLNQFVDPQPGFHANNDIFLDPYLNTPCDQLSTLADCDCEPNKKAGCIGFIPESVMRGMPADVFRNFPNNAVSIGLASQGAKSEGYQPGNTLYTKVGNLEFDTRGTIVQAPTVGPPVTSNSWPCQNGKCQYPNENTAQYAGHLVSELVQVPPVKPSGPENAGQQHKLYPKKVPGHTQHGGAHVVRHSGDIAPHPAHMAHPAHTQHGGAHVVRHSGDIAAHPAHMAHPAHHVGRDSADLNIGHGNPNLVHRYAGDTKAMAEAAAHGQSV